MSRGKQVANDHDAEFAQERPAFMGALATFGLKYEQVKAAYLAAGLPKPSQGGSELRGRLVAGLRLGKGLAGVVAEEVALREGAAASLGRIVQDYRLGYLDSLVSGEAP